jgi:hypothetical protein
LPATFSVAGISDASLLRELLKMDAPVSVYGSPLVSAIITAKWHEGVKWHLLNQGIWFLLYFGLFMAFQVGGLLAEQLVVAGRVLTEEGCVLPAVQGCCTVNSRLPAALWLLAGEPP